MMQVGGKKKSVRLIRVIGRPGSPPPELLNGEITASRPSWEWHRGASATHERASAAPVFSRARFAPSSLLVSPYSQSNFSG